MTTATKAPTGQNNPRTGSKIQRLVDRLKAGEGASLDEMSEATGWQPHTVRAALTGLRKRGYQIDRRVEGSITVWSISGDAQ